MKKIINIKDGKKVNDIIEEFKNKNYGNKEIKIINVDLKSLLDERGNVIFKKNDLYVNANTLFDIMSDIGDIGSYHTHGLTVDQVVLAIQTISKSRDVRVSYCNRYLIVTLSVLENGTEIVAIIEKDVGLNNDHFAKINKLVTLYPMNDE